jgi:hypothetical protein
MTQGLLSLEMAANYLDYSKRAMRRLIDRSRKRLSGQEVRGPVIRFFQPFPGADIKFRQEWLDEFIDQGSHDPKATPITGGIKRRKSKKETASTAPTITVQPAYGFDSSLFSL